MNDTHVRQGKTIQQRTGRTFHLATRLLPERVREPTYVLYGFFRICDEVVDDPGDATPAEQRAHLDRLRDQALGRVDPEEPLLAAFCDLRERHDIADADVEAFVDAMQSDIEKDRYADYGELEAYMDGSAAAVGRMMTAVMETDGGTEETLDHATALGEAFQLTNFLRDVREDVVDRDRVYLPATTLERHGVSHADVDALDFSEAFAAAMRDELRRAERLYREGVAGIQYLPTDCQFGVLLAAVLYADHHRVIRRQGCDVLSTAPSLGRVRKLSLLARTWWHWRRTRDPETVFRRVSAVGATDERSTETPPRDTLPTR
ncbi:phytoene/squalene synthase family protein [Halomicrococcus gelatinilyticus]|uniref:phytoene/squalene synthase family protein n=1 Tax=Halomicrococcus gelatinilyticus TaxID=1702103 RepID=UPI002E148359